MKRAISLILSIVIILSLMLAITVSAAGYSGGCGENLTWTLEDGVLTISGTGEMDDFGPSKSPWYDYDITSVVIKSGVTTIGDYAFYYCSSLTEVTIPSGVTSIGEKAFSYCTGLEEITIPVSFDEKLGSRVNRLNGSNRFETNLMILKEAGVKAGEEILVCTSTNFADSLSASATGKPILLVYNEGGKLFDNQKECLATLSGNTFTILGGEGAVSEKMAGLIGAYGTTTRLAGASRFETSVMVAEKYFENPDSAVLAYAWNYPDGLCGGGLAYSMNAPLILTMTKYETRGAKDYIQGQGIGNAVVLGGTGLISDDCVKNIFGTEPTVIE